MKRENIFNILKQNYDIQNEISKINDILKNEYLFCMINEKNKVIRHYTFFYFVDKFLFNDYKYKNTCLNVQEFYRSCNAELQTKSSDDVIINFLEVTENLLKLYFDKSDFLFKKYKIRCYDTYNNLSLLMDTLEKHMGIKLKEYKDKIILYVGDYKLEKALENVQDADLAVQLVKYDRENLDYKDKKLILKQMDIHIEPIIDEIKKRYKNNKNAIWQMADDLGFILNNINIRHNNGSKSSNDYKIGLSKFNKNDYNEAYDVAYQLIINLLILNDYENNQAIKVKRYKTLINT